MTRKEIQGCIDYRVGVIEKNLGIEITLDYAPQYGGYSIYTGHWSTGGMCIMQPNRRMTPKETLMYLDGIYNLILDLKNGNVKITL